MNVQDKTLARYLFQNKILTADGQIFEDIFSAIMNYAETDFQQIKPLKPLFSSKKLRPRY